VVVAPVLVAVVPVESEPVLVVAPLVAPLLVPLPPHPANPAARPPVSAKSATLNP
jgi:hypothetical protein